MRCQSTVIKLNRDKLRIPRIAIDALKKAEGHVGAQNVNTVTIGHRDEVVIQLHFNDNKIYFRRNFPWNLFHSKNLNTN